MKVQCSICRGPWRPPCVAICIIIITQTHWKNAHGSYCDSQTAWNRPVHIATQPETLDEPLLYTCRRHRLPHIILLQSTCLKLKYWYKCYVHSLSSFPAYTSGHHVVSSAKWRARSCLRISVKPETKVNPWLPTFVLPWQLLEIAPQFDFWLLLRTHHRAGREGRKDVSRGHISRTLDINAHIYPYTRLLPLHRPALKRQTEAKTQPAEGKTEWLLVNTNTHKHQQATGYYTKSPSKINALLNLTTVRTNRQFNQDCFHNTIKTQPWASTQRTYVQTRKWNYISRRESVEASEKIQYVSPSLTRSHSIHSFLSLCLTLSFLSRSSICVCPEAGNRYSMLTNDYAPAYLPTRHKETCIILKLCYPLFRS